VAPEVLEAAKLPPLLPSKVIIDEAE